MILAKVYRKPGCRSCGKYTFECVYVFVLFLFCDCKFSLFLYFSHFVQEVQICKFCFSTFNNTQSPRKCVRRMTNLNHNPCSLKLLSLNVRGLSNFWKRRAIHTWCHKQKADLIFLQETHSTKATESQRKKEWGSQFFFSHASANARGVAVLIKTGLDIYCYLT